MQRPEPRRPAAPAPDDEPPVVYAGFHGLRVMPCSGQSPGDFQPNSVVVVLPTITAPAAFRPTTAGASSATGVGIGGAAAAARREAGEIDQVLHRARHAVEHPERAADAPARLALAGRLQRARVHHRERVEPGLSRATRSVTACSTSTGLSARRA